MNYRDLFNRDTHINEVFPDYIQPRLDVDYEDESYATRLKVHGVLIGIMALISLIILFATKWAIGGWVTAAILIAATVFIKPIFYTTLGYTTWVLARFGIYVWGATSVLTFITLMGNKNVGGLFFFSLLFLTISIIINATGGLIRWLNNRNTDGGGGYVDADPETRTPADEVWERLLTKLANHYSPSSNFVDIPRPSQHEYETKEEYIAALQEHEEVINERKMDVVDSYIDSIVDDPSEDGLVTVTLRTDDEKGLLNNLNEKLGFYGVNRVTPATPQPGGTVIFTVATLPTPSPMERLEEMKTGAGFFTNNSSGRITAWTAGIDEKNTCITLPLAHTLVLGLTGAGKGSLFRGVTAHFAPYVAQGLAKLYFIDPKNGEGKPFRKIKHLFEAIETKSEQMADVVDEVYEILKSRQDMEDEWEISPENPVIVLQADEIPSLTTDPVFIKRKDPALENMTTAQKLFQILAQGRSDRVIVIGATQYGTKEVLGKLRDNFSVRISLRAEKVSDMEYFLGVKSGEVTEIGLSTEDNGYKTAGIGYMRLEGRKGASLVRMGFMSNPEFLELGQTYSAPERTYTTTVSQPQNVARKQSQLPDDYDPRNPLGKQSEQGLEQLKQYEAQLFEQETAEYRDPELDAVLAAFDKED